MSPVAATTSPLSTVDVPAAGIACQWSKWAFTDARSLEVSSQRFRKAPASQPSSIRAVTGTPAPTSSSRIASALSIRKSYPLTKALPALIGSCARNALTSASISPGVSTSRPIATSGTYSSRPRHFSGVWSA